MTIKIGINGMGRIGRMIVRSIFENQNKNLKIFVLTFNNRSNDHSTNSTHPINSNFNSHF